MKRRSKKAEGEAPAVPKAAPKGAPKGKAATDRDYVLLEARHGYEKGDIIRNWPRNLTQQGLDEGWLTEA